MISRPMMSQSMHRQARPRPFPSVPLRLERPIAAVYLSWNAPGAGRNGTGPMISYTLKCANDHRFDSWFQSAEAYDKLKAAGMVACAVCGDTHVEKAMMAPRVRPARAAAETPAPNDRPLSAPASPAEQALAELRRKIEENSENVGKDFATEARAIHEGSAPERAIHGEAKPDEARALIEDGVPVTPLPFSLNRKTN